MTDEPTAVRWHTREDSGLTIDRHGRWWHDGVRIEHPNIVEAFNQGLRVNAQGRIELHFGGDWCFVTTEGCAFSVLAVDESEGQRLSIRLSDRSAEWLDHTQLALDDEGVLTVAVKAGNARARFNREAQFQLAEHFEAYDGLLSIRVGDRLWPTPLSV
jgi:uncharacterized protein